MSSNSNAVLKQLGMAVGIPRGWLAAAGLLACWQVLGQTAPPNPAPAEDSLTEIVVTGTQLRGVGPGGSTVITVDQADMINSGLTTTSDILHAVPQITNIGPGEGNTGSSANNGFLNTTGANAEMRA